MKHSCNAYTQGDENPTLPSLCGEGPGERSLRMKIFIISLFCFLPLLVSAQQANFSREEIEKDKDFIELQKSIKPFGDKIELLQAEYNDYTSTQKNDPKLMQSLSERYKQVSSEVDSVLISFIKGHTKSFISLIALSQILEAKAVPVKEIDALYNKISTMVKNTDLGIALGSQIQSSLLNAVGSEASDFTQNDGSGKPVKLSDFRGKYVLVDFWASWCGPCRKENPNVVSAYKAFKDKNFEILGVSLDNNKVAWQNAIKSDGLTWTHVSDLKGWKNDVAVLFGIQSIPQNLLLDPKGIIIGKNLRGEELLQVLSETIK
jgi:peroxiredoxin